jgi:TnpA family transposase
MVTAPAPQSEVKAWNRQICLLNLGPACDNRLKQLLSREVDQQAICLLLRLFSSLQRHHRRVSGINRLGRGNSTISLISSELSPISIMWPVLLS